VQKRQSGFTEASKYLAEANLLDVTRPQINAWLVICAIETGNVQIAKQTLRQVLRYDGHLDAAICLELAVVLLRCSDESRAGPGERKWIVQDGRYAAEVILVANVLLSLMNCGEVHYILGLAHILSGNDAAALPELQEAVPWFNHDTPCQDEINNAILLCSRRLNAGTGKAIGPVTVPPAPPRTHAQEVEFRSRLTQARDGGSEGVADFANWESGFEVYDYDLPEILEASAEGKVRSLLLTAARLGAWGVKEIVARLRESPGCLQAVDVSSCAAVGALGKELVNSYPYKRGVSMEAAYTGLPDDDVERLRNRNEDAEKALRRAAAEQQRSASLAEDYLARQELLMQLGREESNDPTLEPPKPSYYPSRWIDGIELKARQAYRDFLAVNPMWGISGPEFHDVNRDLPSVTAKTGDTIDISDVDVNTVLQQKRVDMLTEEGYVKLEAPRPEFDEEEGEEIGDEEGRAARAARDDEVASVPRMSQVPPPLYAAVFGPGDESESESESAISVLDSRRLIGFMVYLGIRASPDEVANAREEREEYEAEEAERVAREQRILEERRAEQERFRRQWEERHQELMAARNDLTRRAKIQHESGGSRQLPKGIGSGQIIAHFTFITMDLQAKMGAALLPPSRFGLKALSEAPRPKPRLGYDLHEALFAGKVEIEEATGTSFGVDAMTLQLRSMASEPIQVAIRRGTIFQQVDWVHKQNLLIAIDYMLTIPPGGVAAKVMMAYCMNVTCSCSAGENMELTEFYFDTSHVLDSQGNVWDHFESCFGHR
jgi:hypothetical protein